MRLPWSHHELRMQAIQQAHDTVANAKTAHAEAMRASHDYWTLKRQYERVEERRRVPR